MNITRIKPVRVQKEGASISGLVDVTYVERVGFLWLVRHLRTRRAMSEYGHCWNWVDESQTYLWGVGRVIKCHGPELLDGKTIEVTKHAK